jgi:LEA14-like dessication related protein
MIDAQLFEQRYALTLRIQNPNSFDLDVNGLSFEVELNGREFAHGVSNKGVLIPAYGESTLEVEVTSSLFNIVDQINALERRQGKSLEYRIHGKISTANHLLSLPFERKGEIGGANSRYSD